MYSASKALKNCSLMIVFSAFIFLNTVYSQTNDDLALPLNVDESEIFPLRSLVNKPFQRQLEAKLNQNPKWKKLISQKRMAVGVVDLSDPKNVKFARVNGNQMMYAASLPKLAILLAAEQALEDNRLEESPELREDMRIMISKSSNAAATRVYDIVGGSEYIEEVLRNPKWELYDPNYGGGLWVGKRYAKGGKRYPDPVMGTSHGATATQVCRYYYLLAMGKLINYERSADMLKQLIDPEIHHKFVNAMDKLEPDATIYRKSGSWKQWHSDSMLCWGPVWRRYILVALVEDSSGEQIMRSLVPEVEEVLKKMQNIK